MTTAWEHLPNARHIDRILALAKNRGAWADAHFPGDRIFAFDLHDKIRCDIIRNGSWESLAFEKFNLGNHWSPAWFALLALLLFDDCAYMLESDPGELAILAAFGDERAKLLLPACKILDNERRTLHYDIPW